MNKDDLEKIKNINEKIKTINKKFLLLKLIRNAKKEFDNFNYEGCIEECEKILKNDSQNCLAYRGLGCATQMLEIYDKAELYFKKALEYSVNKEIEYTLLGNLFYVQDKLERALEYYNLAIIMNDNYEHAYEGRNQAMLEYHLQIVDLQDNLIKTELKRFDY